MKTLDKVPLKTVVFDKEVEESLNPLNRTGGRSPTPPRSIFHQDFTRMKAATSRVFFIHLFFLCNSSSSLAYIVLLVQGIIYSVQSIQPSLLNINMINRTAPSQIFRSILSDFCQWYVQFRFLYLKTILNRFWSWIYFQTNPSLSAHIPGI